MARGGDVSGRVEFGIHHDPDAPVVFGRFSGQKKDCLEEKPSYATTLRSLVHRRTELLSFLRSALLADTEG